MLPGSGNIFFINCLKTVQNLQNVNSKQLILKSFLFKVILGKNVLKRLAVPETDVEHFVIKLPIFKSKGLLEG